MKAEASKETNVCVSSWPLVTLKKKPLFFSGFVEKQELELS